MRGKISFLITDWFLSSKSSQQARYFALGYGICDSKMAALSSLGVLNFGDKTSSNSDSWQDANTALQELDKGR